MAVELDEAVQCAECGLWTVPAGRWVFGGCDGPVRVRDEDAEMGSCVVHGPWPVSAGQDCPACFPPLSPDEPDEVDAVCGHDVPAGFRCGCCDVGSTWGGVSVACSFGPSAGEVVTFGAGSVARGGLLSSQLRRDDDGSASGAVVCRPDLVGSPGVTLAVQRLLVSGGLVLRDVFPMVLEADAELEALYQREQDWLAEHEASSVARAAWLAFEARDAASCPACGEEPHRGSSPLAPFDDAVEFPDVWSPDQAVVCCVCCGTFFTVGAAGTLTKTTQV